MNSEQTTYLEQLFLAYQQNPSSVPEEWQAYFAAWQDAPSDNGTAFTPSAIPAVPGGTETVGEAATAQNNVSRLVQAYRYHGHTVAKVNPLQNELYSVGTLDLAEYGLTESQKNDLFATADVLPTEHASLNDILSTLQHTYTGSLSVQLSDVLNLEERRWLRIELEKTAGKPRFSDDEKLDIYDKLQRANGVEKYLHTKFTGVKRFSLEGGDALIPMIHEMITSGAQQGVEEVVLGMAHRGRLNVLTNVMDKPYAELFAAFSATLKQTEDFGASGDVKYHFGRSSDFTTKHGDKVHLSLHNNPSHLEAVNPVVEGSVRAKQERRGEQGINQVLPFLIHGDSAFCGQGIVPETLNLAGLRGYSTGGTVHVIINNQVGFTANPEDTFSGAYCTDIARMLHVPIFHVNGDDVEACVYAMRVATAYRQAFNKDVFIDLVCYRRHGHNEGDDPAFTQPLMYDFIKKHPVPADLYKEKLTHENSALEDKLNAIDKAFATQMQDAFSAAQKGVETKPDVFNSYWKGFTNKASEKELNTAIDGALLKNVVQACSVLPDDFTPNRKVAKVIEQRVAMWNGEEPLNWGAGEMAAYGALMQEGYSVRLSGQDVQRGTFSHRHALLTDAVTNQRYNPMQTLAKDDATFEAWNSSLSELAVMGFEFGYSLASPKTLTIWEGQFGDFSNGAQIIIDQFLSSSEVKWHRMSGLVLLLPHGFEGQGPEHSSARLERYLQLCAENNMSVAYPTTPAQICHVLRRQMLRTVRKPLVVMTPKSLLRHPQATSMVEELTNDTFHSLIVDAPEKAGKVSNVLLCSGKIYYDLANYAAENNITNTVIMRLEELYPLPLEAIKAELKIYKNYSLKWVQEEPRNMGAWTFVNDNLAPALDVKLSYVGRKASASPAVGSPKRHAEEQESVVKEAFNKS